MKGRFEICAIALMLVLRTNCIQVFEDTNENVTTTALSGDSELVNKSLSLHSTTTESLIELEEVEPRIINDEPSFDYRVTTAPSTTTTSSTTTTHKIPPTLLNTKLEKYQESTGKPGKSLKDLA